jgi:hypothetical protein
MSLNVYEFNSYRPLVTPGAAQTTDIPLNPFNTVMPANAGMFAEVFFGSSGPVDNYVTIAKWIFGWRFQAAGVVSSGATALQEQLLGSAGLQPLTSAIANAVLGQPSIVWTPSGAGAPRNWTLRGHIWVEEP